MRLTRRNAVIQAAAPLVVARHVLGGSGFMAPSDTLRIAGVGVGGMGRRYLQGVESERIVALCDVDPNFAGKVFRKYPQASVHTDWRRLMDREKEFDAVVVATPDHSHALVTLAALELGKHVYCAKPLTRTIAEVRAVRAMAAKKKLATQTSVQSAGSAEARTTEAWLRSGVLGPIREVHVWSDHPLYPAGQVRPTANEPVPPGMDWDLWLGPAEPRPFSRLYHPWLWRAWWDFGSGTVGDMLCHSLHVFFETLQLERPVAVQGNRTTMHGGLFEMDATGKETLPPRIKTPETESYSSVVTWDYPERGSGLPPMRLCWYDGGMRPLRPLELPARMQMPNSGVLYVGEKGKLLTGYDGGRQLLLPEGKFPDTALTVKPAPATRGHYLEWVDAAKTGSKTNCDFALGTRMTEIALLGTLAARTARYLQWDSAAMRITNDQEADALLRPQYRKGWSRELITS